MMFIDTGDCLNYTNSGSFAVIMRRRAFSLQNLHHLVGGGIGCILLEITGNGKNGVAHADLGHAVRAARWDAIVFSGVICHRHSFQIHNIL